MKKVFCLLLALVLVMSVGAAFAGESEYAEHLSISWNGNPTSKMHPDPDGLVPKMLADMFNIDLTIVKYNTNSQEDATLLYSSGEIPDHMLVNQLNINTVLEQELSRPVPISMIEQYAPTVMKLVYTYFPAVKQTAVYDAKTDSLYAIPSGQGEFYPIFMIRQDWLDNLNLKMPTTLEEFREVCRAFREDDPDKNNVKDTYAMAYLADNFSTITPLAYAFGIALPSTNIQQKNDSWYLTEDGKGVEKAQITQKYHDLLAYLADLYQKDYIYPDMAITHSDAETLASDGKVGIQVAGTTMLMKDYVPNGWYAQMGVKNPAANGVPMVPLAGSKAELQSSTWRYHAFGPDTSDAKVIRILQIFEKMVTDNDFHNLIWRGVEGTTFTMKDGMGVLTPEYSTAEQQANAGIKYFIINFRNDEQKIFTFGHVYTELLKYQKMYEVYNELIPAGVIIPSVQEYGSDLKAIEMQFYANVLAGNVKLDDAWDDYVADWKKTNGDKVLAEVYEIYNATK